MSLGSTWGVMGPNISCSWGKICFKMGLGSDSERSSQIATHSALAYSRVGKWWEASVSVSVIWSVRVPPGFSLMWLKNELHLAAGECGGIDLAEALRGRLYNHDLNLFSETLGKHCTSSCFGFRGELRKSSHKRSYWSTWRLDSEREVFNLGF